MSRLRMNFHVVIAFFFLVTCAVVVDSPTINARSSDHQGFMLAAAVGIPDPGGPGPAPCHTNPDYLNPILRFYFAGGRPLMPTSEIPPCPDSLVNDPFGVAFNARGELFVGNRHGNQLDVGSIARFLFDNRGNIIPNGKITDASLIAVHGLAFSRAGELFAANYYGTISRFLFDHTGNAVPNGTIDGVRGIGLVFSRTGELFVTSGYSGDIYRYLFDPRTGVAVPNGGFIIPDLLGLHGIAFSPRGELFAADVYTNTVYRFRFDNTGAMIPNGSFRLDGGTIGLAFNPNGELFVSHHRSGGISRFGFDVSGNPILREHIPTELGLGFVAVYPSVP